MWLWIFLATLSVFWGLSEWVTDRKFETVRRRMAKLEDLLVKMTSVLRKEVLSRRGPSLDGKHEVFEDDEPTLDEQPKD